MPICETFASLCGESSRQGQPAFFIRTSGCNLRCRWCDTAYAWEGGAARKVVSLVREVEESGQRLVVLTGGEPLLHSGINLLGAALADHGCTVLVETNGTLPIEALDPRLIRVVDVKPPSAEAALPFRQSNLDHLRPTDELKFVVADRSDLDQTIAFIREFDLVGRCPLLVSPVHGRLAPAVVAEWILETRLPLRLQLQLHKILWGEAARGR